MYFIISPRSNKPTTVKKLVRQASLALSVQDLAEGTGTEANFSPPPATRPLDQDNKKGLAFSRRQGLGTHRSIFLYLHESAPLARTISIPNEIVWNLLRLADTKHQE